MSYLPPTQKPATGSIDPTVYNKPFHDSLQKEILRGIERLFTLCTTLLQKQRPDPTTSDPDWILLQETRRIYEDLISDLRKRSRNYSPSAIALYNHISVSAIFEQYQTAVSEEAVEVQSACILIFDYIGEKRMNTKVCDRAAEWAQLQALSKDLYHRALGIQRANDTQLQRHDADPESPRDLRTDGMEPRQLCEKYVQVACNLVSPFVGKSDDDSCEPPLGVKIAMYRHRVEGLQQVLAATPRARVS